MEKPEEHRERGENSEERVAHAHNDSALSLIVVGTETAVFKHGSRVRERIVAYGRFFKTVSLVVLCGGSFARERFENMVFLPTNSSSRIARLFDGVNIGRGIANADIVTVQDPFETGLVGLFIARRKKAALHVQVHTDFLSPAYARLSALNVLRAMIAGLVLRRAARIRVVSERIGKSIEKKYHPRAPITVLPIFVDLERLRNAEAPPELAARFSKFRTRLLVVARLEPEKNIGLAILAFARGSAADSCLIIVGKGSERERLQTLARTLRVSDRIFFEGGQDAAPYYTIADLVLVPSKYEGYGLVIVEALAAGKPVLSTDVGIAREAGAIVSDENDFADDLRKWFENGPRSAQLKAYPYRSFDDYVRAYCDDIRACTNVKLSL